MQGKLAYEGHGEVDPESETWQAAARRLRLVFILKSIAREEGLEVEEANKVKQEIRKLEKKL